MSPVCLPTAMEVPVVRVGPVPAVPVGIRYWRYRQGMPHPPARWWYVAVAILFAALAADGCGWSSYEVFALRATSPKMAAGSATTNCVKASHGRRTFAMLSDPPQGLTVTVADRSDAEDLASCLRDLSYLSVTVRKK